MNNKINPAAEQGRYGLVTAFCMIVGIVIGSGIFFKGDDILIATNGSILLGLFVFGISAFSIIFGSLTIAQIAHQTSDAGGIISYARHMCGEKFAVCVSYFFTFVYLPSLIGVISWVCVLYFALCFNITLTPILQLFIAFVIISVLFLTNTISYKLGGMVQNAATFIKLIPLIGIAIIGLIWGNGEVLTANIQQDVQSFLNFSWLGAIPPIAFAFDGWIVSTSISHEIKNSKINLPLALVAGALFTLFIYVIYFVGINMLLGPDKIIQQGDHHIEYLSIQLLGAKGAKVILLFILISILGTLNGLILGSCRMPHTLALNKSIPYHQKIAAINPTFDMSIPSVLISYIFCLLYLLLNYSNITHNNYLGNDVSEIAITTTYGMYVIIYIQIMRRNLGIQKQRRLNLPPTDPSIGFWSTYVFPPLAIIGAFTILLGGMQNKFFWFYNLFSILIFWFALWYNKHEKSTSVRN